MFNSCWPGKGALAHLPAVLSGPLAQPMVELQLAAILGADSGYPPLASRQVAGAWSSYLELVIEPAGWMAVWIPSSEVE